MLNMPEFNDTCCKKKFNIFMESEEREYQYLLYELRSPPDLRRGGTGCAVTRILSSFLLKVK